MKILVPYLLTVVFFILHVYEEYLTDFELVAQALSGRPVSEVQFMSFAAFFMPMLLVSGAIIILNRWSYGDYFLRFFFFAMVIAELTHFIFPFLIDGRFTYQSGMYTAALPLVPAIWGLRLMMKEMNQSRAESVPA